ncbi:MAG TPA: phytanoyl-CoA dioxygenase family protein [Planctomycetota bacterium]|nr:phytanoyl-CoA dioxygenase family protein [Planctomycetota bacterium]
MSATLVESQTPVLPPQPLPEARVREILDEFNREGCAVVGRLFTDEQIVAMKEKIDRQFADPGRRDSHHVYNDYIVARLFECDRMFRDFAVSEPIISLMEALLGPDCHMIANTAVRNRPGEALNIWHADDLVCFPLPPEIPRFDRRMIIPTFMLNVQIPLTDIDSEEYGPTQYIPGSHYSGRHPNDPKNPSFEGRGVKSILVRAGEVYLQHSQVWHRGAPNTSTRTRYLLQYSYSMRFVAQRFYPFLNYKMPDHVLEGASPRLLRVLGKHPKAAYG